MHCSEPARSFVQWIAQWVVSTLGCSCSKMGKEKNCKASKNKLVDAQYKISLSQPLSNLPSIPARSLPSAICICTQCSALVTNPKAIIWLVVILHCTLYVVLWGIAWVRLLGGWWWYSWACSKLTVVSCHLSQQLQTADPLNMIGPPSTRQSDISEIMQHW